MVVTFFRGFKDIFQVGTGEIRDRKVEKRGEVRCFLMSEWATVTLSRTWNWTSDDRRTPVEQRA